MTLSQKRIDMAKSTTPDTTPSADIEGDAAAAAAAAAPAAAAAAAAAAPAAAPSPGLKAGESEFLTAVHGLIIHPFTAQAIDVGTPTKVEVDSWVLVQFQAGKLAKA
jgi:hypothetical protein